MGRTADSTSQKARESEESLLWAQVNNGANLTYWRHLATVASGGKSTNDSFAAVANGGKNYNYTKNRNWDVGLVPSPYNFGRVLTVGYFNHELFLVASKEILGAFGF